MKHFICFLSLWVLCQVNNAQKATVTADNKLVVPTDSLTIVYSIHRTELETVKSLTCKAGEILRYAIKFKKDGSTFYGEFEGSLFNEVREMLLPLPKNTKFTLQDVVIGHSEGTAQRTISCMFVISD